MGVVSTATVLSHNFLPLFVFPLGGNAVRFFHFVFFVSGPVSFAFFCRSSFLRVVFWKNFRERTFVFGWLCWSCVFWWVFAIVFALFFGVSLPKLFGKILSMSGLVFFWVRSLFLWFFRRRRRFRLLFLFFSFFRDTVQVVTGHPRTRTCLLVLFLFVSRRFCLFCPFWPCVPLLGVFPGCHSGPRAILGFSLDLLRPFSWDARRQGSSCVSLVLFFFFPFFVCGHTFSRKTGGGLTNPEGSLTHPSEE